MDIKDGERTVIAKPVASRPSSSSFRSFTELLTGAINDSPPNVYSETTVAAIRPKTTRLRPTVTRAPAGVVSSQADMFGPTVCTPSDNVLKSDGKPTVVHKPLAKLVSKTSVSPLENMGDFNTSHQQTLASADARVQHQKIPNHHRHNLRSQSSLNVNYNIPSNKEIDQTTKLVPSQNLEEDPKSLPSGSSGGRASYDGYNWRKYGQKQVKGSEYPRSYYKCTHPNCPVKKKVERSFDGQIAEIVYKGEHNHSKPQPPKRNSSGTQGQEFGSDGTVKDTNNPLGSNHHNERKGGSEGRGLNQNEAGLSTHTTYQGKSLLPCDSIANGAINTHVGTPDNSFGPSGECDEGSKGLEGEDDEPRSKRRRNENQQKEAAILAEAVQEPRIVVQNSTDSEILGDGFRWRKYGQKVVKGNPYPRSYYRCTSIKCNVRKHVERASDDPKAFITTYEGKHNHDMPVRTANPGAPESDSQAPSKDKS